MTNHVAPVLTSLWGVALNVVASALKECLGAAWHSLIGHRDLGVLLAFSGPRWVPWSTGVFRSAPGSGDSPLTMI